MKSDNLKAEFGSSDNIRFGGMTPCDEHGNEIVVKCCKCSALAICCISGVKYTFWYCNSCLYGDPKESPKLIYNPPAKEL